MSGKAKHTAAVSLGVMAAGFAVTIPWADHTWVRLLQSGFEAGLVGGLADWFAVTALFRHPLGIPIPHTALLPNNRRRVTEALITTVEQELISKESIRSKLAGLKIVSRGLEAAERVLESDKTQQSIAVWCERLLDYIPWDRIPALLEKEIRQRIDALEAAPALRKALDQVYEYQGDEKALDFLLDLAEQLVLTRETQHRLGAMAAQAMQGLQTNGFMQLAVNAFLGFYNEEKLGAMIQQFVWNAIRDMKRQGNKNRLALLAELRLRLERWLADPETADTLNGWKVRLLDNWDLAAQTEKWVEQLKERLVETVRAPEFAERYAIPFLKELLHRIREDEQGMAKLEQWIQEQLGRWVEANHSKIGALIRENVDRFDNETLIALMEDKIGSDLQWIRVNGALCGFLIGLVLGTVKLFV
ncbi:DUF445 domain-containing protein [Paenibacillus ehimensis]|uniref:DUF445 domain-containing protein n=1 Tax=Paenibacillus ehimensis TaxID=79264 RepID=UPI003D2D58BB